MEASGKREIGKRKREKKSHPLALGRRSAAVGVGAKGCLSRVTGQSVRENVLRLLLVSEKEAKKKRGRKGGLA